MSERAGREGTRGRGLGARHAERRQRIAEALLAIIDSRGLEAAGLRDVAREAGVSLGAVQHYFRSKDEMVLFGLEYIGKRGDARVRRRLGASPDALPVRAVLRDILVELLPADDRRATELRIATAFTARALVTPELAEHLRRGYESLHELLALLVRRGQVTGEIAGDHDPDRTAAALLALAEGLGTHVLVGHRDAPFGLAVLDAHLDLLFGSEPSAQERPGTRRRE
ncbi:TetR/AcrR family transcriptional regulator [Streptomyces megasporus]|uniref:TetR/AcrR family transcriptional regulator n=1 Tax=Streptomyces megasporus TaxID=44060 RepID=UPI000B0729AF|nr:TetR/AcrR family transcriptional regulator [Streptomyces megasporus]